ncbi:hypothetical protein SESBI_30490 [Sesbania bispinosa]|nr:hypothetical protein SESBI_30490 [Sesbania bispinosa]
MFAFFFSGSHGGCNLYDDGVSVSASRWRGRWQTALAARAMANGAAGEDEGERCWLRLRWQTMLGAIPFSTVLSLMSHFFFWVTLLDVLLC